MKNNVILLIDPAGREIPLPEPEKPARTSALAEYMQGPERRSEDLVKITRSFSFKLNLGNYESCDFFTSQTAECHPGQATEFSQALYEWCEEQTMNAVKDVKRRRQEKWKATA